MADDPDYPRHPVFTNWPLIPSWDEIIVPFLIAHPDDKSAIVEEWKRDHPDWFVAGTHPLPPPRVDPNAPPGQDDGGGGRSYAPRGPSPRDLGTYPPPPAPTMEPGVPPGDDTSWGAPLRADLDWRERSIAPVIPPRPRHLRPTAKEVGVPGPLLHPLQASADQPPFDWTSIGSPIPLPDPSTLSVAHFMELAAEAKARRAQGPAQPRNDSPDGPRGSPAATAPAAATAPDATVTTVHKNVSRKPEEPDPAAIVQASATGMDTAVAGGALVLGGIVYMLTKRPSAPLSTPVPPMRTEPPPPASPDGGKSAQPQPAKPRKATLPDDRRKYILDGDGKGGGGHGPGRNTPDKSEFPPGWSDEKVVDEIIDVANDPASIRKVQSGGRTIVEGTRDGIDIRVVIGADGHTIINGFPTNVPRNRKD